MLEDHNERDAEKLGRGMADLTEGPSLVRARALPAQVRGEESEGGRAPLRGI